MFMKHAIFNKQLFRFESLQNSLSRIYLNKDPFQYGTKLVEVAAKKISTLELEDKNNFGSTKEIQEKLLSYEPSLFRQKIKNDFDYSFPMKFIDSKNFRKCGVGLHRLSQRRFSIKEEKNGDLKPKLYRGGDFMKLVTLSSIFVDKTMFIKEIIDDGDEALLITMPRRWGKSLNLDMLRRFLSIPIDKNGQPITNVTTDNYKLFAGGEVILNNEDEEKKIISPCKLAMNNPEILRKSQGKFPVIFMDFKDCNGENSDEVKLKLKKRIIATIDSFKYLKKSKETIYEEKIGKKYTELLKSAKSGDIDDAILELSSLLYHHHKKQVWILIDEYDVAANEAYIEFKEEESKKVAKLFRRVLQSALKGNPFLKKGVMTGVLPVLIKDMSSGLNNVKIIDVTSSTYSKYYGIDQEEMNLLLEHFKIDYQTASQIKYWYNGYKSDYGTDKEPVFVDKYNIWSVVSYLKERKAFRSYWENSVLGTFINAKVLTNTTIKNYLESLILKDHLLLENMKPVFGIDEFRVLKAIIDKHDVIEIQDEGVKVLFTYLFFNGYLTNTSKKDEYAIPNNEIRREFAEKLLYYYKQVLTISPEDLTTLTLDLDSIFSKSDINEISGILTKEFGPKLQAVIQILEIYSADKNPEAVKGVLGNEDLVHSLLNFIALQVKDGKFGTEVITTKTDGSKGRSDLTLSKNGTSIIIEMKYTKDKKNKKLSIERINQDAFRQAKGYEEFIKDSNTKVFVVCNVTDTKEVFLSGEISNGEKSVEFEFPTQKKDDCHND